MMPKSPSPYSANKCAQLKKFAKAVWGHPGDVLRQSGGIQFIDLEGYPVFRQLFAGAVSHDKILVREEFHIALEALETEIYRQGAYVTGQPGIGKTLFLVYVLVVCLGKKRAVALQLPDGRPYYALFHHSVSFHSFNDLEPLEKFPFLWALSDSNKQVESPHGIFLGDPEEIRVIQATSPQKNRWKEWSKQTSAVGYVMDIWSENEIVDLAKLLKLDAERMTFLATQWGCVPRTLLEFIRPQPSVSERQVNCQIEEIYRQDALTAVIRCGAMIRGIADKALLDDAPSHIFLCRPGSTEYGINRKLSRPTVPTPTIRRLLGEALQHVDNNTRLNFFLALRQFSETSQAAGNIFENWFHSFFLAGNTIQCNWMHTGDISSITGSTNLVATNWRAVKVKQPPYYWVANNNFPGIDSALVLATEIYVFQVTISSTHKSPTEGMRRFRRHLPTELKDIPWRVVFVGDDAGAISAVTKQWMGNIFLPRNSTSVPIAWSMVEPMGEGIIYEEFREESVESESVESDEEMEVV